jgi:multidrug efflux pump
VGGIVRRGKRSMVVYLLIAGVMALLFMRLPTSFLPDEDQAFPAGANDAAAGRLERAAAAGGRAGAAVLRQAARGGGVNVITGQNGDQSSARAFVKLKDWAERTGKGQSAAALARRANKELSTVRDARVFVLLPPAVRGLGANAGFNFHLKDINGLGHDALVKARDQAIELLSKRPEVVNVRSNNLDDTPSSRWTSTTRAPAR